MVCLSFEMCRGLSRSHTLFACSTKAYMKYTLCMCMFLLCIIKWRRQRVKKKNTQYYHPTNNIKQHLQGITTVEKKQ